MTLLVAFVFIFSGPFGTYAQMNFGERVLYWLPAVFLALAIGGLACEIERRCFPAFNRYRHGLLSAIGFSILYSPLIFMISRSGVLVEVENNVPFWYVLAAVFAFAVILGLFIVANAEPWDQVEDEKVTLPRLYARLPDVGSARVIHITVSDHYVEIWMNDGVKHRILMRLTDAINEMDGTEGFSTHRSHWVAADYIKQGKRVGNKEVVELLCGATVPVSKTYRENLAQAGFMA